MDISYCTLKSNKITIPQRIILLSDLHNEPYEGIVNAVANKTPDIIAVVGDIVERHKRLYSRSLGFLRSLSKIAPTYFSYGNHEVKFNVLSESDIENTGAILLNNDYKMHGEILIGGHTPFSNFSWLDEFENENEFKLLLCHQPEYYKNYLKHRDLDLILSGHAHGGQCRPFGIPLYAPGQGIFPRYTSGLYDGKLIVGRGLSDARVVPRLFNPIEVVVIDVKPK